MTLSGFHPILVASVGPAVPAVGTSGGHSRPYERSTLRAGGNRSSVSAQRYASSGEVRR